MATPERRALLLVGHGSHLSAASSAPVHAHAASVAASGAFDEVGVAFWKEEPALSRGLDQFDAADVTVVPIFMSEGYFTDEVLPAELGLTGREGEVHGRRVRVTPPVGTHPALADVLLLRAREAGAGPRDAVAVLGHGTRRNGQSEAAIIAQADRLRATGAFAEVVTVFLDQDPGMGRTFDLTSRRSVVMVPLFVSDGWHVGETIPQELALEGAELRSGGRRLRYTDAVGTHPAVADVVLELAGAERGPRPIRDGRDALVHGAGARWLEERLHFEEPFTFGEAQVGFSGTMVRITPAEGGGRRMVAREPADLAAMTSRDERGNYRPLPGMLTMPRTWEATVPREEAAAYLAALYPLAVQHVEMADRRELRVAGLDAVFARQRGRYRVAGRLDDAGREAAREVLCGRCVKQPLWAPGTLLTPADPSEGTTVAIPCPEPCSVMLSLCREAALWQEERPRPAPPDPEVPAAAFDIPGNEVREAYLQRRYAGRRVSTDG